MVLLGVASSPSSHCSVVGSTMSSPPLPDWEARGGAIPLNASGLVPTLDSTMLSPHSLAGKHEEGQFPRMHLALCQRSTPQRRRCRRSGSTTLRSLARDQFSVPGGDTCARSAERNSPAVTCMKKKGRPRPVSVGS